MASNKSGKVHTALPRDPQRPGWVWGHVQKYLDPRPLTSRPEACLAPGGPFLLAVRGRGWVGRGEKEFLQLWEEQTGEEPGLSCSQRQGKCTSGRSLAQSQPLRTNHTLTPTSQGHGGTQEGHLMT